MSHFRHSDLAQDRDHYGKGSASMSMYTEGKIEAFHAHEERQCRHASDDILCPFPWGYDERAHIHVRESDLRHRLPTTRLVPRYPSFRDKHANMRFQCPVGVSIDNHLDSSSQSAFSTPRKLTMFGNSSVLEYSSPVPSLISSCHSISPLSCVEAPTSTSQRHYDERLDYVTDDQRDNFYFTPLQYHEENLKDVDNVAFDYSGLELSLEEEGQTPDYRSVSCMYDDPNNYVLGQISQNLHSAQGSSRYLHGLDYQAQFCSHTEQSLYVCDKSRSNDPIIDLTSYSGFPPLLKTSYENDLHGKLCDASALAKLGSPDTTLKLSAAAVNPARQSPSSTTSLLPQNLKGDPQRQAKVKTELCVHYKNGSECPFGNKCNYAHGEEELKYTKLFELEKAGLISDMNSYRTHPCISWVSTGACPFGQRCVNIHDPTVKGSHGSWLPHTEIPSNNCPLTTNVDVKYHSMLASLHQENPLIHDVIWKKQNLKRLVDNDSCVKKSSECESERLIEWEDTYAFVCNIDRGERRESKRICELKAVISSRRFDTAISMKRVTAEGSHQKRLSELQHICIAVAMSYSGFDLPIHRNYVYNPRHLVFNKLCMVLQTRYFLLVEDRKRNYIGSNVKVLIDSVAREISADEYGTRRSPWDRRFPYTPHNVMVVRELAFAPCGDIAANVSIWFDISSNDVIACTQQQIKKHKRASMKSLQLKSTSSINTRDPDHGSSSPVAGSEIEYRSSSDESSLNSSLDLFRVHPYKPFYHMQPVTDDASFDRLIRSMMHHRVKTLVSRQLRGEAFSRACEELGKEEAELHDEFEALRFHSNIWKWESGREKTTLETTVPSCSMMYCPTVSASPTTVLWKSFIRTSRTIFKTQAENGTTEDSLCHEKRRLPTFWKLSESENTLRCGRDNVLPQIRMQPKACATAKNRSHAWKSILLHDDAFKDWQILHDCFKS